MLYFSSNLFARTPTIHNSQPYPTPIMNYTPAEIVLSRFVPSRPTFAAASSSLPEMRSPCDLSGVLSVFAHF